MRKLIRNNRGQGTTEYIVILAIVVGLAIGVFYKPLHDALTDKVKTVSTGIASAGSGN